MSQLVEYVTNDRLCGLIEVCIVHNEPASALGFIDEMALDCENRIEVFQVSMCESTGLARGTNLESLSQG